MRLIKKKCPYCGADLEYHYGEHEAKCNFCKQSLIVEYEKLSFTEVKAMLDYYSAKLDEARRSYDFDDYDFLGGLIDEKEKQERKATKAVNLLMIVVMCVIIVCIASMTMWLKWKWKKKAELIEAQKTIEEAKSEAYQSLLEMNEAKTQLDVHLKEMGRLEDRIRMIEKDSNTETEEIKASQLKLEEKRGVTESLRGVSCTSSSTSYCFHLLLNCST